jgi:superfamily II DNA helicase RecQ
MLAVIKDNIHMIIVDECHQVLSSRHFRSSFGAFERLYDLGIPRLFMTATMPLNLQARFLEVAKVDQSSYNIIRSKRTQRANLGWCLLANLKEGKRASYQDLFSLAHRMEKELKKKPSDRGIIFVRNKADVEQICGLHLLKHKSTWLGLCNIHYLEYH